MHVANWEEELPVNQSEPRYDITPSQSYDCRCATWHLSTVGSEHLLMSANVWALLWLHLTTYTMVAMVTSIWNILPSGNPNVPCVWDMSERFQLELQHDTHDRYLPTIMYNCIYRCVSCTLKYTWLMLVLIQRHGFQTSDRLDRDYYISSDHIAGACH